MVFVCLTHISAIWLESAPSTPLPKQLREIEVKRPVYKVVAKFVAVPECPVWEISFIDMCIVVYYYSAGTSLQHRL